MIAGMTTFEIIILVISILLLGGIVAAVLILVGMGRSSKSSLYNELHIFQQQLSDSLGRQDIRIGQLSEQLAKTIQGLTSNLNEQLGQTQQLTQHMQKAMADRLETAGKTVADLRGQLGQLDRATQNILNVGTDVRKLQDILQRPALRGGLGEWSLDNLLREVLPQSSYTLQYRFKNGMVVDALVELAQGRVAIDAKFPLANFQSMLEAIGEPQRLKHRRTFLRDVCKRIDEISEKYIVPDEETLDFALMYVPAENVYYETIIPRSDKEPDVNAYGRRRWVVPVSPNTLYSYLMVIAAGLKGLQIEKNAQVIRRRLSRFSGDLQSFINDFAVIGKHVNDAKNKYEEAGRKLDRFRITLDEFEQATAPDEELPEIPS